MGELTRVLHAARLGNRAALEQFVISGYTDVRRLCAALVDEQSADDLAQDTLLRATRAIGYFRGDASGRDEAAAVCDCPRGTIWSRVARARDDLIGLIGLIAGEHAPRWATSG
jgi:DNA-directed RNA polymerase specialized sigma24 family protein